MAREIKTVIRSDLSGEVIPEGEAVTITIRFEDRERSRVELDGSEREVQELIAKGREVRRRPRRGRKASTSDE